MSYCPDYHSKYCDVTMCIECKLGSGRKRIIAYEFKKVHNACPVCDGYSIISNKKLPGLTRFADMNCNVCGGSGKFIVMDM